MSMLSLILCATSFAVSFAATRCAVSAGVVATMSIGYAYGILRGNIQQAASHFIYDAGVIGLYLAVMTRHLSPIAKCKLRPLMPWFLCLIGWPILMFFVPAQDLMVQLVGLRGNIFFLPFLLIGAMMDSREYRRLARAMVILNAVVLVFAIAEVVFGIERFYAATNPVNLTIFRSNDVVYDGESHYRIPATFVSSAAYASNMVASLPLLIGGLAQENRQSMWRYPMACAIGLAALGVFLSGSRSAVAPLLILSIFGVLPRGARNVPRGIWVGLTLVVAAAVAVTPRMQRFLTLEDTGYVAQRIHGSINQNFISLAIEYPMGNGLGGGGTSLPYFLQDRLSDPVGLENEYARIMAEQGIPGLLLWLGFIVWLAMRPPAPGSNPWYKGKSLARLFCLISFVTAPIGLGMLDAIPGTEMLLMLAGWFAAPEPIMAITGGRERNTLPPAVEAAVQA
ncbi:MAG: O-antigen ligase family protein [Deltaproteobacteria bacterium]|nr:O-antigen ligase family protein [Deltaproteobacteria bacterium]